MLESVKRTLREGIPNFYHAWKYFNSPGLERRVKKILATDQIPAQLGYEQFEDLQSNCKPWWPTYAYDDLGNWKRGVERAIEVFSRFDLCTPGLNILDVACGDGMTGFAFSTYGHTVTLCDIEDRRDKRASQLPFLRGDICADLELGLETFDFIFSYNAFEHFPKPKVALDKIKQACKVGGLMYFCFDPLYYAPLGLHAFAFNMPYPQILFSDALIRKKLTELGNPDLGRVMDDLQYLNKWRPAQFRELFSESGCELSLYRENRDSRHLHFVTSYPAAFAGLGLTLEDITVSGIEVLLRKKAQ